MIVTYPVIFTEVDTNILIEIPDLEILTETNENGGKKKEVEDAIIMAKDAIATLYISMSNQKEEMKDPSSLECIDISKGTFTKYGKSIVLMVSVDLPEYKINI